MLKLRTEIEQMPLRQRISCRDGIFVLGSCFADNIGSWLKDSQLNVCNNPFGVLYNPASIASALGKMIEGGRRQDQNSYTEADVVKGPDGMFYSFSHHGKFSTTTSGELVVALNKTQQDAEKSFAKAKHILVTFGTSWIYEREGKVVANCHKFPASTFSRRRLSVEEIVNLWSPLIEAMTAKGGEEDAKHIVFTVSPIRHIKDTLHGNQLSKATLLLAIDQLCQLYPTKVEYLPIYELLVDDLRDYRFYAEDLVHPSALAIDIVKEYFMSNCLDAECVLYLKEIEPLVKAMQHRPLHPESNAYQTLLQQTEQKIKSLKQRYLI